MSLSISGFASGDEALPSVAGEAPTPEREPRTNLFLSAQIVLPGDSPRDVRIRNLSRSGARIDGPRVPPPGTTLLLCRGGAQVASEVRWSAPGRCGLQFTQAIDVARWVSDRPGPTVLAQPREPSLAEDIALARQLLARLEDVLASDMRAIAALGTELQAIDLLSQLLLASERRAAGSTVPAIHGLQQAAATFLRQPRG